MLSVKLSLLSLAVVLFSSGCLADLPGAIRPYQGNESPIGELAIEFELCCTGRSMGYALWVEDADGHYVDTIVRYRSYRQHENAALPEWESSRVGDLDGETHASAYAGEAQIWKWDGRDSNGAPVAAGTYELCLEVNDWDAPNCVTREAIAVDSAAVEEQATNCNAAGSVRFEYTPYLP